MQIVYISNRPAVFAETLQHVALFMPFIERVVVCVPDKLESVYRSITSNFQIQIVPESSVLFKEEIASFSALDHQRRNYLLRGRLVRSDIVDSQFIMTDDDARPLKPISLDTFIKDGRHRRYFFYDLAVWSSNQTEFDAGQIATYAVLDYENLEHLSYASHMPQIVDKAMFVETSDFFSRHAKNHPLCEWSTYFNFAANRYPERFLPAEAFVTLCWPEHPLSWRHFIEPASYSFENYTPSLYQSRGVFKNLGSDAKVRENIITVNIEKIILWKTYTIMCLHPERTKGLKKYFRFRTWINKLFRRR